MAERTYEQKTRLKQKLKGGQTATRKIKRDGSKGEWRVHDHRAPMSGAGPRRDKKLREAEEKAVGKRK